MAAQANKLTPMMQQYMEVKRQLPPNSLLLFRLGDFYEMFDDDARMGAEVLGITLTMRNGQPMAGIPYHAADSYIPKVLAAGKKVAICDQVETPRPGQLVKRALTRILTPGTTLEDHQLESRRNHYLLACDFSPKGQLTAAWLDLSTGDFAVAAETKVDALTSTFASLDPREVVLPEDARAHWLRAGVDERAISALYEFLANRTVSEVSGFHFDPSEGCRSVLETLGVLNLDGFGVAKDHPGLGPAGALLRYATDSLRAPPQNLSRLRAHRVDQTLLLDPATLRNLEIFRSSTHTREGSLLHAMDRCVTAPGARRLEAVLAAPALDLELIHFRQNCVGEFLEAPAIAGELQDYLKGIRDLPRILGRLRNRLRNPRELGAIRDTLLQLPSIRETLATLDGPHLANLAAGIEEFPHLFDLLHRALAEDLPNQLQEGGYIADGYDTDLDRIRSLTRDSKTWISDLEASEAARTGIKKLKIRFNNAFGYFIEVTKANLHLVPDDYIRKQTTVNAERFYTPELKEKEREILHADEKAIAREEELFRGIVDSVLEHATALEATAATLADLDLLIGWSVLAREWNYVQPIVDDSDKLEIEGGRHPVVEQMMRRERLKGLPGEHDFVPNDTALSASGEQIAVITGPNMAGKSTYIRQVALIALMAQVGSWVPAAKCRIGLVDRIFSRVGASDELSRGNSTFMVEMNETANILNNATARSLIILDEIGRGTSTYDGLSIAWAVVEHLHGDGTAGPRTLFATHYHELTQIDQQLPRVANHCVAVKEWNDRIIFVRQVVKGAADRSYGIQVARLAGLPPTVIDRAKVILSKLESEDSSHNLLRLRLKERRKRQAAGEDPDEAQLSLF
ncbi:MAG: DNA mismatch repair protein MutS [Opitutales bacterium]|nr:DNA mismatch repair protein MutS [Opitutales bacterium]